MTAPSTSTINDAFKLRSFPLVSLVRAIAVVMIVCGHLHVINYGGGGALTLMLLAGFTYAKYLLPKLSDRYLANERHIFLMLKVAIPKLIYQTIQFAMPGRPINWSALGFHSNLIALDNHAAWFVEAYIQINLVLLLIAQNTRCARWLEKLQKFGPALYCALASILFCTIVGYFWDTAVLLDRVPHRMLWLFACGILLAGSAGWRHRLVFVLVSVAGCYVWGGAAPIFLVACICVLGLAETVRVPAFFVPALSEISAASLLVYLTHYWWIKAVLKILPTTPPVVLVVIGISGGVAVQIIYNRFWKLVRDRLPMRKSDVKISVSN